MTDWKHDDLAYDLGRWLKSGAEHWVWLNSALGEWSGPRPDVMAYRRHRYQAPLIRAYEAKVSRSDLLSDLRAEKWKSYLEHCASVTFIMPTGLCKKEEIPAECGVMFRSARGWRTERRPQDIGHPASVIAMAKLLTVHPLVMPDADPNLRYRRDGWRSHACNSFVRQMGKEFGRDVQAYFLMKAEGRDPITDAREKAAKIVEAAKLEAAANADLLKPVLAALGIAETAGAWEISSAIRQRAHELSRDGQLIAIRSALAAATRALADADRVALPLVDAA